MKITIKFLKNFLLILIFCFLAIYGFYLFKFFNILIPENWQYVNLKSNQASIIYFTKMPVRGCYLGIGFLAKPVFGCEEKANLSHFIALKNLSFNKKYFFFIWHRGLFYFLSNEKEALFGEKGLLISSSSAIPKQNTIFKKKFFPSLMFLREENKGESPLIIKGRVMAKNPEENLVIFTNLLTQKKIAALTNFQGNFIIDVSSLLPLEKVQITIINNENEHTFFMAGDKLLKDNFIFLQF